ncbi:hypothetical protein AYK26_01040 [Euryarchaeota archaeon SM23-78]|nr:MAG: hypothetical protein AYK26_01040 [Euryarchaeota archaeon SM23-78]MBW3001140.1 histidine phosphatase family protein [Candidatus Woesearchaeota archaeon]
MKLILVRHGETIENKKNILQGQNPGRLSRRGIEQGKKLALRLKNVKIDIIYSSDLKRAADTAKMIAKYHPKIPIHFVKELREADLGSYTGKNWRKVDWKNKPDDVESSESMQGRAKKFLDKVYDKHPDNTVLFVGHNGINLALINVIQNKPPDKIVKIESQKNTAVNIFEIREDKNHVIHLLNCVKHLE